MRITRFAPCLFLVLCFSSVSCGNLLTKVFLGGGGRPGDGDEGIPGYIARLRGIRLTRGAAGISVSAEPGTVAAISGSPENLRVLGFVVSTTDLETIIDADQSEVYLSSGRLATFT